MVNDAYLTRYQLALVLGVHENTANKRYKQFLAKVGKEETQKLTMFDVQKVEKLPIEYIRFKIYGRE